MAAPGRASIVEQGWPLGEFQSGAVELEPDGSAQTITGLVGDDGLPYRRGGVTYKSNAALGAAGLLTVANARLTVGNRTLFTNSADVARLNAGDDTSVVTVQAAVNPRFTRPVVVGGVIIYLTTAPIMFAFGGSTSTAGTIYSTGTVSLTPNSRTVTGVGTLFQSDANRPSLGSLLIVNGAMVPIATVDSETQLTLYTPWPEDYGTIAGAAFSARSAFSGGGVTPASDSVLGVAGNRLLLAVKSKLYFSRPLYPFDDSQSDYHEFQQQIIGVGGIRDTAMVFTAAGVYAVSNLAYDLTDAAGNPQQRKELVNADLIAWGHEGIAPWKGSLVVPALDGVWLMDGVSAPVRISDHISDLYLSYVRAGHKAGIAEVFNGHYLLPILNSSNVWVDTLVCRLQPTHQGPGFAWSQLSGFGAQVTAFAERSSAPPLLLGASTATSSRVIEATSYFSPTAAVKNDADATTHTWQFTTRNIPLGDRPTAALTLTANYSLVDAASDNPAITAEASVDGGNWTTLTVSTGTNGTTTAGEQDGSQTVYWTVGLAGRFIRFRFTCTSPAASLQFKRLELRYRPRGN